MLEITLNGEKKILADSVTIQTLVEQLRFDPTRVAVEVNREVVPRIEHERYRLQPGDVVEIVTMVGGG